MTTFCIYISATGDMCLIRTNILTWSLKKYFNRLRSSYLRCPTAHSPCLLPDPECLVSFSPLLFPKRVRGEWLKSNLATQDELQPFDRWHHVSGLLGSSRFANKIDRRFAIKSMKSNSSGLNEGEQRQQINTCKRNMVWHVQGKGACMRATDWNL